MAGCVPPVYHAVLSGNAETALLRRAGIGTRSATLHLRTPAPLLQVAGGLLSGGIADLDVVIDRNCASGPGHTGCRAFVLYHVGLAFDGGHAALNVNRELVGIDFRFRELGAKIGRASCRE